MTILFYLLFVVINVILAYRDAQLIKKHQRIYHGFNATVYVFLLILVHLATSNPLLILALLIQRVSVFNTALNYFRGLSLTYISDSTTSIIDQITNWIPKKVGYWYYHAALILISLILISV
jgi:hypothetical protein